MHDIIRNMKNNPFIPIIAIDGTASSGKGTVAYKLAQKLEFNYLNSGALYRLVAYQALKDGLDLTDEEKVINVAKNISPIFEGKKVIVDDVDIWPIISTQEYGQHASVISPIKELREVVFDLQRKMIKTPGLVAEGRDMCTHVFTDAHVKFYLDADVKERAKRRHKDETEKQSGKTLDEIIDELILRDQRDKDPKRGSSQLSPAEDGHIIDTTSVNIDEVMNICIDHCKNKHII